MAMLAERRHQPVALSLWGTFVPVGIALAGIATASFAQAGWRMAGAVAEMFSSRSRESAPPGLSEAAVAGLKTLRLGERVSVSGRMGAIAGSGLFDLSTLFGKSDADNRQFLQVPRFVARVDALAAAKKK